MLEGSIKTKLKIKALVKALGKERDFDCFQMELKQQLWLYEEGKLPNASFLEYAHKISAEIWIS